MWTERRSGKNEFKRDNDYRSPYERDVTRVIHSPAFRRLQRKSQILRIGAGDFHRTRLTHSLEVASIGKSLLRTIQLIEKNLPVEIWPNDELITSISLLHDIGHPPFGHAGEIALNYAMRYHGGFEGNGQTLRLLTKLERSYGLYGLDLTRRSLLGILKYPVSYSSVVKRCLVETTNQANKTVVALNEWVPPKAYLDTEIKEVAWILQFLTDSDRKLFQALSSIPTNKDHGKSRYKSLDCSIMDVADDIAYGVHDLEDAIHLRLIQRDQLDTIKFKSLFKQAVPDLSVNKWLKKIFSQDIFERKQAIGDMVNYFITHVTLYVTHPAFEENTLKYNVSLPAKALALLENFKQCVFEYLIDSQEIQTHSYGGQSIILNLFEVLNNNPLCLLDNNNRKKYKIAENEKQKYRIICDYIASMTDEYAYRLSRRLAGDSSQVIFDRL